MRRRLFTTSLLLAVGLCSRGAHAQDQGARDHAVAAFNEARQLIDAGDCTAAAPKLRESLTDEPSIGAMLSMADCLEPADPLAAWGYVRDAGVLAHAQKDDRSHVIELRAATIARNLPGIAFQLAPGDAALPGLDVRVDGRHIEPSVLTWPIYAVGEGEHIVEVSAQDRRPWSARVTAMPHVVAKVIPLLEVAAPPPTKSAPVPATRWEAPLTPTSDSTSTRRSAGVALVASGAGALVLGATFAVLTVRKNAEISDACGGDTSRCAGSPATIEGERESARTFAAITNVSLVVGGALAAGGIVLVLTAPSGSSTARAPATSVGFNPSGVTLRGTW